MKIYRRFDKKAKMPSDMQKEVEIIARNKHLEEMSKIDGLSRAIDIALLLAGAVIGLAIISQIVR